MTQSKYSPVAGIPASYKEAIKNEKKLIKLLPKMVCKHCLTQNPFSYFAPVLGQCVCFACAEKRGWINKDGNLKKGIEL